MKSKIPSSIIVSFLHDNFEVKETSTGELRINSPFTQDNKFHLYINPEQGVFKDFKTDMSGSFSYMVAQYLDIPEGNVLTHLVKEYGLKKIETTEYKKTVEEQAKLELPEGLHFFKDGNLGLFGNMALEYLRERLISEEYIQEMGYVFNSSSEYHNRIFIPFYENGEIVYYICRDFTGTSYLRYANPHKINSKQFVYNIDRLQDTLFICEGIFDVLSIRNIVGTALLSANLGEIQAKKIMERAPKNIIFVPDNDETGDKTLDDNVKLLMKYTPPSLNTQFYVYRLEEGIKDLNYRLVKRNKDTILIEECEKYNESKKLQLKPAKRSVVEV